jgi:AcrR family transcriptional regulator
MSSQKSILPAVAREPKRLRGKRRVEALLDAAAWAFGEKGYDGATMTEIAARADTAIGSLYQFFPNKEALADALLARYGERLEAGLEHVENRAAMLGPCGLAAALVDLMLELRSDRASAIALLDARDVAGVSRAALRQMMLRRLPACVLAAGPAIGATRAQAIAMLLLHVMKAIPVLAAEGEAAGTDTVGEARDMIGLHLVHALGSGRESP